LRARFRADIFNSLFAFRTPTRARLEHTMRATLALRTTPGLARARVAPPRRNTRGVTVPAAVHTQRDKNGRRDFYAENQEYYKKKEITNAMLVGAAIPAVVTCAASWQLAMSAEATAAWFMSAAGITEQMEILNMEYST
jgi:hypothetical protein